MVSRAIASGSPSIMWTGQIGYLAGIGMAWWAGHLVLAPVASGRAVCGGSGLAGFVEVGE